MPRSRAAATSTPCGRFDIQSSTSCRAVGLSHDHIANARLRKCTARAWIPKSMAYHRSFFIPPHASGTSFGVTAALVTSAR